MGVGGGGCCSSTFNGVDLGWGGGAVVRLLMGLSGGLLLFNWCWGCFLGRWFICRMSYISCSVGLPGPVTGRSSKWHLGAGRAILLEADTRLIVW